jgi:hypothetical protein
LIRPAAHGASPPSSRASPHREARGLWRRAWVAGIRATSPRAPGLVALHCPVPRTEEHAVAGPDAASQHQDRRADLASSTGQSRQGSGRAQPDGTFALSGRDDVRSQDQKIGCQCSDSPPAFRSSGRLDTGEPCWTMSHRPAGLDGGFMLTGKRIDLVFNPVHIVKGCKLCTSDHHRLERLDVPDLHHCQ